MARTPSNMLPLGTRAPGFILPDTVSGGDRDLQELRGSKGTLIMFICNHCPFVKHVNSELVRLAGDYMPRGVSFIAVSSNDVANYPDDSPAKMKETARREGYPFPYLYDETQEVARQYDAACTPDFYLFNDKLELVYRGQLDDSRPGNGIPVSGEDLEGAIRLLLKGEPIPPEQKPSIGCNIKWKVNP
ncbi:thioredoxin family protein [Robiginitalea sp. SC105]|uniref:thioredoxin family protein n=1 Tax=Robiginitalea sp. SC105 TaxID=2762332 RepID=UPI00163A7043|nr:thioredoxin family protein [Robiginitalea sp. SC105]MBC2839913.1 thioredoxin family protein [Robiginitalea sp. SC105]